MSQLTLSRVFLTRNTEEPTHGTIERHRTTSSAQPWRTALGPPIASTIRLRENVGKRRGELWVNYGRIMGESMGESMGELRFPRFSHIFTREPEKKGK